DLHEPRLAGDQPVQSPVQLGQLASPPDQETRSFAGGCHPLCPFVTPHPRRGGPAPRRLRGPTRSRSGPPPPPNPIPPPATPRPARAGSAATRAGAVASARGPPPAHRGGGGHAPRPPPRPCRTRQPFPPGDRLGPGRVRGRRGPGSGIRLR